MALKTAFLLLTIVLAVRASNINENNPLTQKLNGDLNSVCNELLGVPCKNSPPPPPSSEGGTLPPTPSPEEDTLPPTPSSDEVPVPVPGPESGEGVATGLIEVQLPDGVSLSPSQRQTIFDLLQTQISGNGVITPSVVGRKLLAAETLSFTVTLVISCPDLATVLDTYIQSGQLVTDSNAENIPIEAATLLSLLCAGAGVATVTNVAPSTAPAPAPARR